MNPRWRLVLAAFLYAAITLAIALIGGGWWGLGRVDPLLAVPGLGWAGAAMLWAAGPLTWRQAAGVGGAVAMMVAIIAGIWGAGAFPWPQVAVFAFASMGLAVAIARWVWPVCERTPIARLPLFLSRFLRTAIIGLGISGLSWLLLPSLYALPVQSGGPRVAVMTSLPLTGSQNGVAAVLAGEGADEPALALLRRRYRVTMVDAVDSAALANANILLLAHPHALAPQQYVAIDAWVRGGGRAMILADGLSSWPPLYPLGDPRNPPLTSLLTPLLSHWGVTLDAPPGLVASEEAVVDSGQRLHLYSAGRFAIQGGGCRLLASAAIADCRIGHGRAIIVADADWLDASHWGGVTGVGGPANWHSGNMLWLMNRLDTLAGREPARAWAQPIWTE
ncbi:MAG: Gldg family protein [Sphingopyxis sp.]